MAWELSSWSWTQRGCYLPLSRLRWAIRMRRLPPSIWANITNARVYRFPEVLSASGTPCSKYAYSAQEFSLVAKPFFASFAAGFEEDGKEKDSLSRNR